MRKSVESRIVSVATYLDHEFANYIQTISGWLQLGATDKAREAAALAQEAISERSHARRLLPEKEAAMVLEWLSESASQGVLANVKVEEKTCSLSSDLRQTISTALSALTEICERMTLSFSRSLITIVGVVGGCAGEGALESLPHSIRRKLLVSGRQIELRIRPGAGR